MDRKRNKITFLASTYFECVSDELRKTVLQESLINNCVLQDTEEEPNNEYKRMLDIVFRESNSYEEILHYLQLITHSDMIIMFQVSGGTKILEKTEYDKLVILAETNNLERSRYFPIVRSELLKFFRLSNSVLAIEETVKIVNIESEQKDSIVEEYRRVPCTISYIVLNYGVDSESFEDKYIYFALFYKLKADDTYIPLPEILPNVRNLLLFRPYLIKRIKKDFEKNVYGRDKETAWKNQWLSIEKAGAHADSDLIDGVINKSGYDNQCISKLFFGRTSDGANVAHEKNVIQLVSNVLIARYFRLLFSSVKSNHMIIDAVDSNNTLLKDIIQFNKEQTIIELENGNQIHIEYDENVFYDWMLCQTISNKKSKNRGLESITKNTFRKKYLIAFLVDVFNNISKRSSKVKISIKENSGSICSYLIIQNSVVKDIAANSKLYCSNWDDLDVTQRIEWCKDLNYRLKQSIEFENAESYDIKRGISLGCLNAFIKAFPFGNIKAMYTVQNDEIWYQLELPIIKNKQGEM